MTLTWKQTTDHTYHATAQCGDMAASSTASTAKDAQIAALGLLLNMMYAKRK